VLGKRPEDPLQARTVLPNGGGGLCLAERPMVRRMKPLGGVIGNLGIVLRIQERCHADGEKS